MTVAEVNVWMAHHDTPMQEVIERVRRIVLVSDSRIDECIRWSTPTFTYKGRAMASFYPKGSMYATLIFHKAGLLPQRFPHLEFAPRDARAMHVISIAEAELLRDEIGQIVSSWIRWSDAEALVDSSKFA